MNKLIFILLSIFTLSCSLDANKHLLRKEDPIDINISWINPDTPIEWDTLLKNELINELKKTKEAFPHKFMEKYILILEYSGTEKDTFRTDGKIFIQKNKYYKAEKNILQKYLK